MLDYLNKNTFFFLQNQTRETMQKAYKLRLITNQLEEKETNRWSSFNLKTSAIAKNTGEQILNYTAKFLSRANTKPQRNCREDREKSLQILRRLTDQTFNKLLELGYRNQPLLVSQWNSARNNLDQAERFIRTKALPQSVYIPKEIESCDISICSIPKELKDYYFENIKDIKLDEMDDLTAEVINAVKRFNDNVLRYKKTVNSINNFLPTVEKQLNAVEVFVQKSELLITEKLNKVRYYPSTKYRKDIITCEFIDIMRDFIEDTREVAGEVDGVRRLNIVKYFGNRKFERAKNELLEVCNEDPSEIYDALNKLDIQKEELRFGYGQHEH